MFEVEMKARVTNLHALHEFLSSNNFEKKTYETIDYYFKHPCRDFIPRDEELRVRIEKENNIPRILVTYKGSSLSKDRSAREEIEIPVTSIGIIKLLMGLGFEIDLVKRKKGFIFSKKDLKISVCEVSGILQRKLINLGHFVEVEKLVKRKEDINHAREEILNILRSLPGVGGIETKYYTELVKELAEKTHI
ncbi:MAG: class IV adenylate cyclase [Candidatus Njordarchaeales archaeon]